MVHPSYGKFCTGETEEGTIDHGPRTMDHRRWIMVSTIRMLAKTYTFLALGDSYSVGESLSISESFPYQTVQQLRRKGFAFHAPEIVAKTGWTTDELQKAISKTKLQESYDFVSVLIGVNNQYRGRSEEEYASQFEDIVKQGIRFSANKPSHVFVFSIPDWGVTAFAEGRDRQQIAKEIDQFNVVNKKIANKFGVHYIDITPETREAADDDKLLAIDMLHPSAREYSRWAEKLTAEILNMINLPTHEL